MVIHYSRSTATLVAGAVACVLGMSHATVRAAPAPLSTPYAQAFNTLASTGTNIRWTDDSTIPGWYASRVVYNTGTGSSNAGALYSFGTAGDRALGSLASGSTGSLTYGVRLVNDTANTITAVAVQYTGEQWREGGSSSSTLSVAQNLTFSYKISDGNLSGGSFNSVSGLDFTGPHFGVTAAAALDGNATANRAVVSGNITGLSVLPGQVLWLQWVDINDANNDHGLAIDDLQVTVTGSDGGTGGAGAGGAGAGGAGTGGGGAGGGDPGDPCAAPDVTIGSVQGTGAAATTTGVVTVQGVVVGDYEGASPRLRGFYIQDDGDGNSASSDGIFVFNAGDDVVSLGDEVQVTGTVSEFQEQTQLSLATIVHCTSGNSVTPAPVSLPVATPTDLERYEGMLVRFSQTLYVTEMFQLGRFGQVTVSANGRLPQPTSIVDPGAAAAAALAQNNLARIIIDDATQDQNPDPIVFGRGGLPLTAGNTLRGGDSVAGLQGVMTYTWAGAAASGDAYRVRPVNALGSTLPNFVATNPRPTQPPVVAGALKVASFNLLNYFNTFGTTSCTFGVGGAAAECRGASDSGEYTRQANKTVPAIALLDADVLGVIEIENDGYGASSAIQDLVNRVNAVMGTNTYAFIDFDARLSRTNAGGTDAIKVGILYKPASVTPVAGATFGDPDPIHNRAPLAQTFQQISNGERFTLIVNHFKSKSCDSASGADIDQNDGQGCYNARRVSQAHALVSFIQQITTATGDPDVLMMGDLNSYAKEDPISVLLAGGLTNLTLQFGGPNAYSYAFDGQWGYLDHALATASATLQVKDAADFHINSDEPSVLDYLNDFKSANQQTILYAPDAYRTSDHDPAVVSLQLGKTVAAVPATHPYLVAWLALGLIAVGAGLWRRAHQH